MRTSTRGIVCSLPGHWLAHRLISRSNTPDVGSRSEIIIVIDEARLCALSKTFSGPIMVSELVSEQAPASSPGPHLSVSCLVTPDPFVVIFAFTAMI